MQNSVSPSPTADEAVAISTALEMLWPKPQPVATTTVQTSWRFSGRLGLTQFWRVAADQTKNVGAAARPAGH